MKRVAALASMLGLLSLVGCSGGDDSSPGPVDTTHYTLSVSGGTGGGSYQAGAVAAISAVAPNAGAVFSKWTGDIGTVANVSAGSTTITMPSNNVSVTATFVAIPPSGGGGSGGGGTDTNGAIHTVPSEIVKYGDGISAILEGIFDNQNVIPLTVSIAGSGYVFVDNGDGTLTGTAGTDGTIEYETGRWSLDFKGMAPDNLSQFIARYQWREAPVAH